MTRAPKFLKNYLTILLTYAILYPEVREVDKRIFKKNDDELREYLEFRRRGSVVKARKGKGSYNRKEKYYGKLEKYYSL